MTDKFTFRRFDLLWSYYHPAIMRQWLWTTVIVLAFFCITILARCIESITLFSFINSMLFLPVYLGPLVFAIYNDRGTQIQLPATASEKATFYIFHSLVIMPVAVLVIWLSLNGLYTSTWGHGSGIYEFFAAQMLKDFIYADIDITSPIFLAQRTFMELLPIAVTLYTVLAARTHRILKGIGAAVGTNIAYGIVSGMVGFATALANISTLENMADGVEDNTALIINDIVSTLLTVLSICSAACLILFIYLIYRKVKRMDD